MRLNSPATLVLLGFLALHSGAKASDKSTRTEQRAWPPSFRCEHCMHVQFGKLDMQLPLSKVGRLLVLGSDIGGLNIFPRSNKPTESLLLMSIPHERLVGRYEEAGLLRRDAQMSNREFFDRLGQPAVAPDPFASIRQIEKVVTARFYLKATRGTLHAYAVQSSPPLAETVYFVIEGEDVAYALYGRITPEIYQFLLANMQVTAIP